MRCSLSGFFVFLIMLGFFAMPVSAQSEMTKADISAKDILAWKVEQRKAKQDGIEYPSSCAAEALASGRYKFHLVQDFKGQTRFLLQYPAAVFSEEDRKNRYPLRLIFDNESTTMRPVIIEQDARVFADDVLEIHFPEKDFDILALQMADRFEIEGLTQDLKFTINAWPQTAMAFDQCLRSGQEEIRRLAQQRRNAQERGKYPELLQKIMDHAKLGDFTPVEKRETLDGETYIWKHGAIDGAIILHETALAGDKTLPHFASDFITTLKVDCPRGIAHEIGNTHDAQDNPVSVLRADAACARMTDRVMAAMTFVAQGENVVIFLLKSPEEKAAQAIEARNRIADSIF